MNQKTTLQDFCEFLERELSIALTTEQWKIYRAEKESALINERNQMVHAYFAATNQFDKSTPIVRPKSAKVYINEKYGKPHQ